MFKYGLYLDKIQVNMQYYLPRIFQIYLHIIINLYNNSKFISLKTCEMIMYMYVTFLLYIMYSYNALNISMFITH